MERFTLQNILLWENLVLIWDFILIANNQMEFIYTEKAVRTASKTV